MDMWTPPVSTWGSVGSMTQSWDGLATWKMEVYFQSKVRKSTPSKNNLPNFEYLCNRKFHQSTYIYVPFIDLTAELMRVKRLSDFMREIRIVRSKNKPPEILVGNIMDNLVSEAIIFFDRACFTLDYSLHFGLQTDFIFRNDTGLDNVLMHFKDKTYYTSRPIYEQKLNHQGATLTINLKDNMLRSFTSELKQEVFVEEDMSKDCTNYPNSKPHKTSKANRKPSIVETK